MKGRSKLKKFLAITLTLALTLALFAFPLPANAAATTQATSSTMFSEDFNGYTACTTAAAYKTALTNNGFAIVTTAPENTPDFFEDDTTAYSNGNKLTVPHGSELYATTGNIDGSEEWSEYSVSVDVTYDDELDERATNSYAMVVLNTTGTARGGYEFGINYTKKDTENGDAKLLLRRRNSGGEFSPITYKTANFEFEIGKAYTLKLTYKAGIVYAYVNGQLFASHNTVNDTYGSEGGDNAEKILMLTKGPAGFRKNGFDFNISFDNFKVEKEEKTVWFNEDFSYTSATEVEAAGWNDAEGLYGSIIEGEASLSGDSSKLFTTENAKGVAVWDDYTVEADVTLSENTATEGNFLVGIMGRMNGTYGYECGITLSQSGSVALRLRSIAKKNETIGSVSLDKFTEKTVYHITMKMYGSTIVCSASYGDNCKEFTCDTSASDYAGEVYSRGYVGIRCIKPTAGTISGSVDNVKVTGYNPITEYFNETFSNTVTATQLEALGYAVSSKSDFESELSTIAGYISNGKISFPSSMSKSAALYNNSFASSDYTVETDFVLNKAPSETATYQVSIGEGDTNTKGAIRVNLSALSTGVISQIRLQYSSATNATFTNAATYSIPSTNNHALRPKVGDKIHIVLSIRYDETAKQTIANATVTCKNVGLNYQTGDCKLPTANGKYEGWSAISSSSYGGVSFDNYKAYSVNPYTSPVIGELDGDNIVTAADGRYIRECLLGVNTATEANLNTDTVTDIRDLVHFNKVFEFYK